MVEDTGVGIKDEDKDKLFKLFGKLENTESATINPSGTGLGLNISNKLAKKLGPNTSQGIQVDSTYGIGSTFSFLLEHKVEK